MSVYISHSRENSGAALKLSDELVKRGVEPWLDMRELDGGADWREKVSAAIRDAEGCIFVMGKGYPPDAQQRFDWQQVVDLEIDLDPTKPLVPVEIEPITEPRGVYGNEFPGFLSSRHIVHLHEGNLNYSEAADRVVHLLRHPAETINQEKLKSARQNRVAALESLKKYAYTLEKESVTRSGLRGTK